MCDECRKGRGALSALEGRVITCVLRSKKAKKLGSTIVCVTLAFSFFKTAKTLFGTGKSQGECVCKTIKRLFKMFKMIYW
ncbi:MAG TPA: hypothetical protein DHV12_06910 [Thermotogae bacterium]|nr:hypothetical protein [Thermotogota bacterium]